MASNGVKRASGFHGPSGSMAEVTWDDDRVPRLQWIVQSGSANAIKPSLDLSDGSSLAPPADPHNLAGKDVILLPSMLGDRMSTSLLLGRLEAFVDRYCDIPPLWSSIIAHYCLMSWVFDRFDAVGYLRFLGEPQSGKTRCLFTAAHLCYKAVIGSGATSSSALFRLLDVWKGTFIIDEADMSRTDLSSDIVKILNGGYARGLTVLRSEKNGVGYEPSGFQVFGPKILSTRREFEDSALESRCLTFRMPDRPLAHRIPRQLPPEFYSEALELRNQCLAWRLDFWHCISSDQSQLLSLSPRFTQISVPIWAVSELSGREPSFLKASLSFRLSFLEWMTCANKTSRSLSPGSLVVESLRRLTVNANVWPVFLGVKEISEQVAEVSSDWGAELKLSPKACGELLRSFGLETFRRSGMYELGLSKKVLDDLVGRHSS